MANPFQASSPVVPVRCVHLDLKGFPPTPKRLDGLLRVFVAARFNAVLVEWEDSFPWTVDERFRGETAYAPEQVRAFATRAAELGIEVIPLVQCLGHMETPLRWDEYAALREVPHLSDCLNPLAPGARDLVQRMVDDALRLTPNVRHFHLGGDEAWNLGAHPQTRTFIEAHGKAALYFQHVEPLLDALLARNVRPILWHDMMEQWPDDALRRLAGKADLMVWGYNGSPETTRGHHRVEVIERFAAAGVPMWGASAFKGADGPVRDLPNGDARAANALGWAQTARRFGMKGVCATGWSRYSTENSQVGPIDACLDVLVDQAVILHDGARTAGAPEACLALLDGLGEGEAFRARRQAVAAFVEACDACWSGLRDAWELLANVGPDRSRRAGSVEPLHVRAVNGRLKQAEARAAEVRPHFDGLVPTVWIDRWLGGRVGSISRQTAEATRALEGALDRPSNSAERR